MSNEPLNILLITSDQQHWHTLGCNNPEISTPNLDRLAKTGVRFDRAYCPNPTCTPARASIITGLYPSQHGAYAIGAKLPESQHTVGEDFQAAGYHTALIGKAHFQPLKGTKEYPSLESHPILRDVDFWRTFNEPFYGFVQAEMARNHTDEHHVGQHYGIWMEDKGLHNWRDYFRPADGKRSGRRWKWELPVEYHYNEWIVERSCTTIDKCREEKKPFFMWASFPDPHPDFLIPEPWDTMYDPAKVTVPQIVDGEHAQNPPHFQMTQEAKPDFSMYKESPDSAANDGLKSHVQDRESLAKDIAIYYAMISYMDDAIGRILDKLEQAGIADNTLVVFTTDHGHFFGQHGFNRKGPFHYEDVIRIPFIASGPGVSEGKISDSLQSLVDLAPTFLSYAGLPVPRTMSGIDQRPVWSGEKETLRDHVLVENRHQPTKLNILTYVDERYKMTVYYGREYGEIFDLQEDPEELRNLWNSPEHTELKQSLLLKFLHAEMVRDPLWMPRVSAA